MSILAITDLAPSRGLTTLADVKQELGITGGTDDAFLLDLIAQTSTAIEGWCNRAFARETLTETFRLSCSVSVLHLTRWPVIAITSVVEDGTVLGSIDTELDPSSGELWRLNGADDRSLWPPAKIVIAYEAGYRLPGTPDRDLPADLERACIEAIKARWFARLRDPLVKGEEVPGVAVADYWVPADGSGDPGLPPIVIGMLWRWRLPTI